MGEGFRPHLTPRRPIHYNDRSGIRGIRQPESPPERSAESPRYSGAIRQVVHDSNVSVDVEDI